MFSDDERVGLGSALETLFSSQDKYLSSDKKTILINSLQESNIPSAAIIKGMQSLYDSDLKMVKLFVIKNAARKFIEYTHRQGCDRCFGSGYITLVDADKNDFVFACLCDLGKDKKEIEKIAQWNGRAEQTLHAKTFKLKDADLIPHTPALVFSRASSVNKPFGIFAPEEK